MNSTTSIPRFDTSLALFAGSLVPVLGRDVIEAGWIVRNSEGRLTFVSKAPLTDEEKASATAAALQATGKYCLEGLTVASLEQPGISGLIKRSHPYQESIPLDQAVLRVSVVDQRIVGADWLLAPVGSTAGSVPRYVFASIKGGVGRTTAMAVAAADLAGQGQKVLVVDLDLEAPGVGAMLLPPEQMPAFGFLDGLIERALSNMDEEFLFDMVAPSPFGRGKGLIDVVPAVGRSAKESPANVLAKLSRAYVESSSPAGELMGFAAQTRSLVDSLAGIKKYDAVMVDARAGLNESTAAALLGLGAQVFLFGEDTPQTFAGYRYLFAHIARFSRDPNDDWMLRLKMIHAKASPIAERQQAFRDRAYDLFKEFFYCDVPLGEDPTTSAPATPVEDLITVPEFSLDDVDAPHFALPVLRDSNYFEFDPLSLPSQLTSTVYERTYEALLSSLSRSRNFEDLTAGRHDT